MKNRMIALLLVLAMTLSFVPAVFAAEVTASGTCGDNLTWKLTDDGTLTITGTGEMEDYSFDDAQWDSQSRNIKTIVIESGVTSISARAFEYCSALTSVTIPDSVTSIGQRAFYCCTSLTSVTIPDSFTSIGDNAFQGCEGLADSDGFVIVHDNLFDYYGTGGNISIPDGVTSISGSAFELCNSLTSVTIPDSVTSIGICAFYRCNNLTNVTIPDSVTYIGNRAFEGCEGLADSDGFVIVHDILFDFYGTGGNITIPDGVTAISAMVFYNFNLTNVTIPDSVTSIGDMAFDHCSSLTSLTIPDSVTSISKWAFENCTSLSEVIFEGNAPVFGDDVFYYDSITAYYPANDTTWTEEVMQDYGGDVTWVPYVKPFVDIQPNSWFADQVLWAVDNGITNGMGDGTFAPDTTCTRNQIVTFLWRAEGCPEPESTYNPFVDVKESDYFYKAVLWAVENGITNGIDETHFGSNEACTRGQVVTFLHRAAGNPAPASTDNPFTDVGEAYYTTPILWAVGEGITTGMGDSKFEPNTTCTRAQIVTFLYRYKN